MIPAPKLLLEIRAGGQFFAEGQQVVPEQISALVRSRDAAKLAVTIAGGEVVWDGKHFHPRAGRGRFLQCGMPTLLPRK